MRNVSEISNYLANLSYKLTIFYSCDDKSFNQKLEVLTTKVSKEDFYLVDEG